MAHFIRGTGDDANPIQHSKDIFHEHLRLTSLSGMFGKKGSGKPIIMDTTLKGEDGDTKRCHFVPHTYADPLIGQDVTIRGNESTITEYIQDVVINEVNFAFARKGKMTEQRIVLKTREEFRMQLVNHFRQYNEDAYFKTLSGISATDLTGTWKLAAQATDRVQGANRCWRANGSANAAAVTAANSDNTALNSAMASTDKFSPQLLDEAVTTLAEMDAESTSSISYRLNPIRVGANNEEFYIAFLSPRAARDLRYNPEWQAHAYSLAERGLNGADDLIAKGAMGVWNNVIIKESQHVIRFATSGSHYLSRNLLVGADAMISAWAQTTDYTEETDDHRRILSVAASEIRGETKVAFYGNDGATTVDLGVAQLISVG